MSSRPRLPLYPRAVSLVSRLVMSAICRVEVNGLEHVPRSGPVIAVANHLSETDPPLLWGWLAPAAGRRVRWLAKERFFHGPLGLLMRSFGAIPVGHGRDVSAYRTALAVLAAGGAVMLMPEGTRGTAGRMGAPRPGSSLLAVRSGAPVLPVGISGTDRLLGRGERVPHVGARVRLRVGPPFHLLLPPEIERSAALAAADAELMRRIAALVEPRHRGGWEPWAGT